MADVLLLYLVGPVVGRRDVLAVALPLVRELQPGLGPTAWLRREDRALDRRSGDAGRHDVDDADRPDELANTPPSRGLVTDAFGFGPVADRRTSAVGRVV